MPLVLTADRIGHIERRQNNRLSATTSQLRVIIKHCLSFIHPHKNDRGNAVIQEGFELVCDLHVIGRPIAKVLTLVDDDDFNRCTFDTIAHLSNQLVFIALERVPISKLLQDGAQQLEHRHLLAQADIEHGHTARRRDRSTAMM